MIKKISNLVCLFLAIFFAFPALAYIPSDPMYGEQSYLKQINVESAWDIAKGDGVVVAVIDSGVDINHPDLKMNIWKNIDEIAGNGLDDDKNGFVDDVNGWDFISNTNDPRPKLEGKYDPTAINHGTAISGLIGAVANNDRGMAGVAFGAKIMPVMILGADGSGDVANLIKGIDYAVKNGANIINLSLVGFDYSQALSDKVKWAYDRGVLVVAAVGNGNNVSDSGVSLDVFPAYPVCYGNNTNNNWVLAVTAVNQKDIKSSFANYGSNCVDLAAPGEKIWSLGYYDPSQGFSDYYTYNWNGTSFASALTSGVAALMKSKYNFLTPQEISDSLLDGAVSIDAKNPVYQGQLGRGRLDAGRALSATFSISSGRLVKLADSSAVYYLDAQNQRHLFPNEPTYWSWYQGNWSNQPIETVSQNEFNNLNVASNVTARPGANLIRFENSPRLYAVSPGGYTHYIKDEIAQKLFGSAYQQRVIVIQNGFEFDYVRSTEVDQTIYPDGSLIQYAGAQDIWYVADGKKRLVESVGFSANDFNNIFVIKNVSADFSVVEDRPITGLEKDIFVFNI